LAAAAGANFDAMLTVDKKIRNEQGATNLPIAVLVLMSSTNRFDELAPFIPATEAALDRLIPGVLVEVMIPAS
jgi:hypothetical protein